MSVDQIQNLKPKPKIKTPPWISALLALISSVALLFLLLTSMESAFSSIENLFEQSPNLLWFLEIPIPLICAMLFYYNAQHSQKRSLNTLVFLSSATGIGTMGMIVYFIISKSTSLLDSARADFYYILILTGISVICGFLSLIVLILVRRRKFRDTKLTNHMKEND